jgi:hypothetical protein
VRIADCPYILGINGGRVRGRTAQYTRFLRVLGVPGIWQHSIPCEPAITLLMPIYTSCSSSKTTQNIPKQVNHASFYAPIPSNERQIAPLAVLKCLQVGN